MNNKLVMDEKLKVIASNCDKLLVVKDYNIDLDDFDKKASVIDMNGKVYEEEITIGVVIKFGYWKKENMSLKDYKKRDYVDKLFQNALLGYAVGDSFGLPFKYFDKKKIKPILTDNIMSGGYFEIPAGTWGESTSLVVATINSLIDIKKIDYNDIMKKYSDWLMYSKYTPFEKLYTVGNSINNSIKKHLKGIDALNCGENNISHDNDSLKRILPISLYIFFENFPLEKEVEIINEFSSLSNNSEVTKMGCFMYTQFLKEIIKNKNKEFAFEKMCNINYNNFYEQSIIEVFKEILSLSFQKDNEQDIKCSENIVDTLRAVLYSVFKGNDYKSTILTSVKLGNNTDTICALSGAIAGIIYGENNIPDDWIIELQEEEKLRDLSKKFSDIVFEQNKFNIQKNINIENIGVE